MSERRTRPLSSYIRIKHGFAFPGTGFSDDPSFPTLVTPGNFAIGGGFKGTKTKTYSGEYPPEYKLSPGDLMVSMTDLSKEGDTLGLPAIVPEGNFLHNQRIGLVEIIDPNVDSRFLSYFLRTDSYRAHILATASGSTVRHTSPSRIGAFETCLPSLNAQRSIAEVLGALDDKIAANTRISAISSDLAGLLYDREAARVESQPMSKVLRPILGGTPARSKGEEFWGGARLWASAKDITGADFGVVTDTAEKITDRAVDTTKAKALPSGSVILTARGTVGTVGRLAVPASFNQSCYGFVPGLVPAAVLYFGVLRATERAKEIAHGSVFDTITMKTFDHLSVPDFNSTELATTEAILGPLMDSITAAVVQNSTLAATRDALLPQLMSGKLRVKDAEKTLEDAGV
ncbi:conserved hypothetical protein [Pseudarthrobacter chlorophenolicus A6]|uniref:Type I restriction modification DNA specificity domain-containing protein n=1 Tax=Pseudarthrobacter chlorophenolicus (strain ATCC 700700 / DSM 12829 / CIP 107037 / JCM 12360 / KCTC 9906 / NCIMB 13794 / A6) TaxID=452863 RepID=B8HE53_PSECP|nr:restriction endonuclease subunit S [Pseudarthrobacter chlorophenolicus]ACL39088.1 conserved hypothetical protein [Pseudarthrobacter chlorophenolicus A6]SDR04591.1 type I restriction enzyme, S subunit [Pseudarthrobacter chlorophenolicus]